MKFHKPNPDQARTKLFAFKWTGGGYDHAYAKDVHDVAYAVRDDMRTVTKEIADKSIYEIHPSHYWSDTPYLEI